MNKMDLKMSSAKRQPFSQIFVQIYTSSFVPLDRQIILFF